MEDNILGNTILLVDDNRMFIDIQKEYLQDTKVDIITANDGHEALELVKTKRPDVVFMDFDMPRMDGVTCCRAIKSDVELKNIPVIMITSKIKEEEIAHCFSAGCDDIVTKPLDRDTFLYVARKYIPSIDRRERRLNVNIDALLQVKHEIVPCKLYDLSVGGVFLCTDYFGTVNSVVQVSFALPDGTAIECHGRFARINRMKGKSPQGIGIKFALMPKPMKDALTNFIDTYK